MIDATSTRASAGSRAPGLRPQRRGPAPRAFSLAELLVVIAVLAVLLGLLLPAIASARAQGRKTRELSAARQLMLAYAVYAGDHRDMVLPGYLHGLPARDARGRSLTGEAAARYPWRVAPYLDHNLNGLFHNEQRRVLEEMEQTGDENLAYTVSLSPSLGLNTIWVGGHEGDEGMGYHDDYLRLFGRFYVTSMGEVRRPSRLLVFVSARGQDPLVRTSAPVEGYFYVKSPRLTASRGDRWSETFREGDPPSAFGFVSLRHHGEAVCSFADGHTDDLNGLELRDMRRWANRATAEDWALEPRE